MTTPAAKIAAVHQNAVSYARTDASALPVGEPDAARALAKIVSRGGRDFRDA